ncbi:Gti1/Pac2 family-domain-containing protein, partial [Crucibulum laeve]
MQQPTCKKVRIRSTQDAHKIFYAVQKGLLQMVTRRLDADERQALHSGCIYAWEERGPHSEITGLGIERFTEGRRWSPSRVRDEFLFYYEKYSPPSDGSQVGTGSERHPPRDWDPLVKQTYSVWVETEKGRRKWHLTAYFTQQTIDQLGTIDDIPPVRDLIVPDGHFKSTRVGKNRSKSDEQNTRSGETSKPASTVTRTYAPFPSYP